MCFYLISLFYFNIQFYNPEYEEVNNDIFIGIDTVEIQFYDTTQVSEFINGVKNSDRNVHESQLTGNYSWLYDFKVDTICLSDSNWIEKYEIHK